MVLNLDAHFPRYEQFDPAVPVWCVTPGKGRTMHRFFDTSPFSPSGRYLGLTRLTSDTRLPEPGDVAEVVIVDLQTGDESIVAQTRGADTQLGAQVQWGADDTQLFYNDVDTDTWRPFGVVMDARTGESRRIGGVYMVSPDGKHAVSPCLRRMARTQAGYGVIVPPEHIPENDGAPEDDGVYVTDTATGEKRLLVSLAQVFEEAVADEDKDEFAGGNFYTFHVKYTLQRDRIAAVVRWKPEESAPRMRHAVITMKTDGTDLHQAIPFPVWDARGHHPNWTPDGKRIMMNLTVDDTMRLVSANYDGSGLGLMSRVLEGSGHPSLHPDGRHVVTDVYEHGRLAFEDGTAPLRLLDLHEGTETMLCRIRIRPEWAGPRKELRIDPHPAWDRSWRYVAFNACADGLRGVYVADLEALLG